MPRLHLTPYEGIDPTGEDPLRGKPTTWRYGPPTPRVITPIPPPTIPQEAEEEHIPRIGRFRFW